MESANFLRRHEIKYLLTQDQYLHVRQAWQQQIVPDIYGRSTVCSLYFDTPDFRLIRRSLSHPVYKEKLRLRSYGIPDDDGTVFLELKKKFDGVVYKRRAKMTHREAFDFLAQPRPYSRKTEEFSYFLRFYGCLRPTVFIACERTAWIGLREPDLRITFDSDIRWRDRELSLRDGAHGSPILPADTVLMEVKTATAMPLWLTEVLTRERLFPTSFSKYGRAYEFILNRKSEGDQVYV